MKSIVLYSAQWCAPCKALKQWCSTNNVSIDRVVDIDEEPELTQKHRIRGVPTIVILENGEEVGRNTGFDINFMNKLREVNV